MNFVTDFTFTDGININTLDELKAYALGGTGKVEISYVEHHPMTGEQLPPVIRKIEAIQEA